MIAGMAGWLVQGGFRFILGLVIILGIAFDWNGLFDGMADDYRN